jgi:putative hydrolase of the HAD superfamily
MTALPFGALLCDVDGVLRHWDDQGTADLELEFRLPPGSINAAALSHDRLIPAVTGRITDEQWRVVVAADLASLCGSQARARELVERWSRLAGTIDEQVLRLLVELQPRIPIVLVSNATTRLEHDLGQLGITAVLTRVVNSSRIGSAKPDPAIYRAAAQLAGVPTSRCLFVDDTASNVRGAEAVGMTGLVYRSAAELRQWLEALLAPAR